MTQHCKECQHWRGNHPDNVRIEWGRCAMAEHVYGLMKPTAHQATYTPDITGEHAGVLVTHAYFGCVQFTHTEDRR